MLRELYMHLSLEKYYLLTEMISSERHLYPVLRHGMPVAKLPGVISVFPRKKLTMIQTETGSAKFRRSWRPEKLHEDIERQTEPFELGDEASHGSHGAEIQSHDDDLRARGFLLDPAPRLLRRLHIPSWQYKPHPPLRQHPRRLRADPRRRSCTKKRRKSTDVSANGRKFSRRELRRPLGQFLSPVMMAVAEHGENEPASVTCSAVDLEPKPLDPGAPVRYLTTSSIPLSGIHTDS